MAAKTKNMIIRTNAPCFCRIISLCTWSFSAILIDLFVSSAFIELGRGGISARGANN